MEPSSSSSPPPSSYWDAGKLFVGGISWDTGEAALRDHFSKYGEVSEAVSVKDRSTGNPRGFAFVLFSDHASADRALEEKEPHVILGRTVDVKRARCRSEYQNQNQNQNQSKNKGLSKSEPSVNANVGNHVSSKKVFVGGLPFDVREDVFRAYFEKFGVVKDAVVIYDSSTQRSRGFGFVEFEKEETVEEVLRIGRHELNNKVVEVKNAVPKDGYYHKNNSNFDGNSYDPRVPVGVGYGYGYGYYPGGYYPGYGPRYAGWHSYAPPPVPGYMNGAAGYGGGYAFGGYGRFGYRPPFTGPRGPWNQQEVSASRQNPVPYGGGTMYPGYPNGGYYGVQTGGYHGVVLGNEKLDQTGSDVQTKSVIDTITSQVESLKLDAQSTL